MFEFYSLIPTSSNGVTTKLLKKAWTQIFWEKIWSKIPSNSG